MFENPGRESHAPLLLAADVHGNPVCVCVLYVFYVFFLYFINNSILGPNTTKIPKCFVCHKSNLRKNRVLNVGYIVRIT